MTTVQYTKVTPAAQPLPLWKRMPKGTPVRLLAWVYVLDFAEGTAETPSQIARVLSVSEHDVRRAIAAYVKDDEMRYVNRTGVKHLVCCVDGEAQSSVAEAPEHAQWLRDYLLQDDFYHVLKVAGKNTILQRITARDRQEAVLGCLLQTEAVMSRLGCIADPLARAEYVAVCVTTIAALPYTPGKYQRSDAAMLAYNFQMEVPEVPTASAAQPVAPSSRYCEDTVAAVYVRSEAGPGYDFVFTHGDRTARVAAKDFQRKVEIDMSCVRPDKPFALTFSDVSWVFAQ